MSKGMFLSCAPNAIIKNSRFINLEEAIVIENSADIVIDNIHIETPSTKSNTLKPPIKKLEQDKYFRKFSRKTNFSTVNLLKLLATQPLNAVRYLESFTKHADYLHDSKVFNSLLEFVKHIIQSK